jgi:hypothetical protein
MLAGRNSVGVEVEPSYVQLARQNLAKLPFGVSLSIEWAGAELTA